MSAIADLVARQRECIRSAAPSSKLIVQGCYLAIAGVLTAGLAIPMHELFVAAATMAFLGGIVVLIAHVLLGDQGSGGFRKAQAFAFAMFGMMIVPAAWVPTGVHAVPMLAMVISGALLAGLTSFCLGRAMYVLLFARKK